MKRTYKLIALLLAVCLLFAITAGCGGGKGGAAAEKKTLNVGTRRTADTFDPVGTENDIGCFLVYDTILQRDPATMEIVPCVASAWEWTDDTTLVLTIRDDITFSNGEKLTPDDVLYSLWRTKFVNDQYTSSMSFADIDYDASHVDGNKVVLVYQKVNATALAHLTLKFASVLCKSYVESAGEDSFWDKPVGSGSYTLVENIDGSHATFARNEKYWDKLPEASEIVLSFYGEASTMYVDMELGAIDIAIDIAANDAARVMNGESEGVTYQLVPTYDLIYIGLPEYVAAYDDIRVRQAIAYGLDTAAITKTLYGDLAEVADSTTIKGVNYYKSQGVYEYNVEKAKELLAEAGYKDGDLSFRMIAPLTPTNEKFGETVQAYMSEIGIHTEVEIYDFPIAIPMLMNNECEFALGSLNGGQTDAADIYAQHAETSTNGTSRNTDPTLNEYIVAGKSTMDDAARAAAYEKVQQWDHENFRWLPVCYPQSCMAYSEKLASVPTYFYIAPYLKYVTFAA